MFTEKEAMSSCESTVMIQEEMFPAPDGFSVLSGSFALARTKYTKKQLTTIVLFGLANIFSGSIVGMQAPFYPKEAEEKGASATEYGLVMGVFQLVMFIMSSVYGSIFDFVNPRIVYNVGIFLTAISAIIFGFLDYVDDHVTFIALSFLLRILQAFGDSGFVTVSFALIAMEFPDSVATTFATFSTCFGVGLVVGPGLGGALYELGGFILPFVLMGGCFLVVCILTYFLLPEMGLKPQGHQVVAELEKQNKTGFLSLIRIPEVALASLSVGISACTTGFLTATLEPHLRENFGLSPGFTGLMFIIDGVAYAISAPIWGRLVDKSSRPKVFTLCGALLTFTGFLFIGPAPFLPLDTLLWLICIGLIIHGLGTGASCVSAFIQAMRGAVSHGFSDNVTTYGLVSGLWMSSYSLGAFVGPSVGGILLDHVGFKMSSVFVLVAQSVIMISTSILICSPRLFKKSHQLSGETRNYSEQESLLKKKYSVWEGDRPQSTGSYGVY